MPPLVAEATGWPAVLMNPAIDPARDLAAYVGELTAFHAPTSASSSAANTSTNCAP